MAENLDIVRSTELLLSGTMVGEYRVTHKLGEGGMGVVYAGVHPEIGKRVAIKILAPQAAAHADLIRRFKEEARAVNKIRHPNIIDIFAFNQLPDGRHYFVMEYLDGESLTDRLSRGPMDFSEMRRLLAQICSALQAAHEAGVVHRDLKPDNIWVATQTLSESSIKLLDFGIAKLNDVTNGSATRSGVPMGTPLYMPPEQGMGRAIDRRADIYALGVLLYQVFAGTLPFYGASGYEIVLKHVTEPPVPPSRHRPVWPKEMEAIILACLEKDPSLRPATAKLLSERIEAAFVAHAKAPMKAGVASTVPRLTTPPPPPAESESEIVKSPATLPSWVKNLPSAAPGGTSLSQFSGDSQMVKPPRRPAAAAIAAGVVAVGVVAALVVTRRQPDAFSVATSAVTPVASASALAPASAREAPAPVAAPPLQPASAVAKPLSKTVGVRIDSDPAGARVVAKADGAILGKTPLSIERPRSASPLDVRLELDGYKPRELSVPLGSDFHESFELEKRSARSAGSSHHASPTPLIPVQSPPPAKKPGAPEIEWE